MWRAGVGRSEPTRPAAYGIVAALAAEQLSLGHDVIIDAVNGPEAARAHWRELAARQPATFPPWTDERLTVDSVNSRATNLEAASRFLEVRR